MKGKLWKQKQSQQLLQVLLVYSMDSRRKLRRSAQLVLRSVFRSFRVGTPEEKWSGIPGKLAEVVSGFVKHQVTRSSVAEDEAVVFLCGFLQLCAAELSDTALMACLLPITQLAVSPEAKSGLVTQTLRAVTSVFQTQKPQVSQEDSSSGHASENSAANPEQEEEDESLVRWPLDDPSAYQTRIRFRPAFLEGLLSGLLEFRDIKAADVTSSLAFIEAVRIGLQVLRRSNAGKAVELAYQFLPQLAPYLLQSKRSEVRKATFQALCAAIDALLLLPGSSEEILEIGGGRNLFSPVRNGRREAPQPSLVAFLDNLLDPRWRPLWAMAFRLCTRAFAGCAGVPSEVDAEWTESEFPHSTRIFFVVDNY